MKIKLTSLLGAIALIMGALTSPIMAGSFGLGITGAGTYLETTGTETLKDTSIETKGQEENDLVVPSVFVQYTHDLGWVLGMDYIPVDAELGDRSVTKTDVTAAGGAADTITQKGAADFTDHIGFYIETPGWGPAGLYAKAGWSRVKVTTNESLGTGSTYSNSRVDGTSWGLGMKRQLESGLLLKLEASTTEYDSISLTGVDGGDSQDNTITADSQATQLRFSIGYNF